MEAEPPYPEPLWLQRPPEETSPETWLAVGDAIFNLMPELESFSTLSKREQFLVYVLTDAMLRCAIEGARGDRARAHRWFQKRIGDLEARLGEISDDF